jgi:hypothetical protein
MAGKGKVAPNKGWLPDNDPRERSASLHRPMQPIIVSRAGWSFYRRENGKGVMKLADEDISFLQVDAPQDAQDSQDFQDYQDSNRQTEKDNGSSLALSREFLNLSLREYVSIVLKFCDELRASEPEEAWRSPLFNFARFCKAHPLIGDLPEDEAMQRVERSLCEIGRLPEANDPWEHFFPEDENGEMISGDAVRIDFMNSWVSIRHIPFQDVVQRASRLAAMNPLRPPRERGGLYVRFVSLAGWLQVLRSDFSIYLPTRMIGDLLSCDQRTVSYLRKLAIRDGLLTVVKESKFSSRGKSKATEFRFGVQQFGELRSGGDTGREILGVRPTAEDAS